MEVYSYYKFNEINYFVTFGVTWTASYYTQLYVAVLFSELPSPPEQI
jgi:hypothetical protein